MKILALCGSLRRESRSKELLRAMQMLARGKIEFVIYDGLGELPLFNPDMEEHPPQTVLRFWEAVSAADVIVIASPEYAHGVTGTIKNALDWLVGYIPFCNKPVAVLNPSHRATHADEALQETLRTMNANLIAGACLRIPVTASNLSAEALVKEQEFVALIEQVIQAMLRSSKD